MLTRGVVGIVVAAVAACSGGSPALEDRVADLVEDGDVVGGGVDGVVCPAVADPAAGDRTTCVVTVEDGGEVEVDVEHGEGGSITVVAVVPR